MGQNKYFFQIKDSEIANLIYVKILLCSCKQLWFVLYEEIIILKLRKKMLLEYIFGVQINVSHFQCRGKDKNGSMYDNDK